jgi:hypothetical protein
MKLNVLVIALAATALGSLGAAAQTTVIEERRDPAVVIEHDHPDTSVTVQKREGILDSEKKVIRKETTGAGDCTSKTVHKEDVTGSETTHKTTCD